MINIKSILALGTVALLSGCSSRPEMPIAHYSNFAQAIFVIDRCGASGQISPDTAAWAKKMFHYRLSTWTYDANYLSSRYQDMMKYYSPPEPTSEACNQLAINTEEYKQMVQAHNAQVESESRSINAYIQNNRPVNTYCNRIGTQTLCNSY